MHLGTLLQDILMITDFQVYHQEGKAASTLKEEASPNTQGKDQLHLRERAHSPGYYTESIGPLDNQLKSLELGRGGVQERVILQVQRKT
ncbi:hypothetical protein GDO81_017755 [Engystomops pustulosus]|uniref:Uncharacterized protein n=1 Tax=Engystomops pustulosus TaxID=76066 RepID=A0AAV7ABY0_ENGPU|nr:hypothetical protein GDO81_017755 [Engystomops pustulosus]